MKLNFLRILAPFPLVFSINLLAKPSHRADLFTEFASLACAQPGSALPLYSWQRGIFDAGLNISHVIRKDHRPIELTDLSRKARATTQAQQLGGYSYGLCHQASGVQERSRAPEDEHRAPLVAKRPQEGGVIGWLVSVPAPLPLETFCTGAKVGGACESQGYVLNQNAIDDHCSEFRIDYVDQGFRKSKSMPVTTKIDTDSLGNGVMSFTCQPKRPKWRGPVLWYLAPLGKGPALGIPTDRDSPKSKDDLYGWINFVRKKSGLSTLRSDAELERQGSLLAIGGRVTHNRTLLAKTLNDLKLRDYHLQGENRVRGTSLFDLAWLMWNSPRHRDLLLTRASHLGLHIQESRDELFAVLLVAEKLPKLVKGDKQAEKQNL